MYYIEEEKRGLPSEENHAIAGTYEIEINPNEEKYITFACSLDEIKIDRKNGYQEVSREEYEEKINSLIDVNSAELLEQKGVTIKEIIQQIQDYE